MVVVSKSKSENRPQETKVNELGVIVIHFEPALSRFG